MKKYIVILLTCSLILFWIGCDKEEVAQTKALYTGESRSWKVDFKVNSNTISITCFYKEIVDNEVPIQIKFNSGQGEESTGSINYSPSQKAFLANITGKHIATMDYSNEVIKIIYNNIEEEITLTKKY